LWFAEVLLESDATEAEIVPTLAIARRAEVLRTIRDLGQREHAARQLVERHPAFDLIEVLNGVPVLRMKPAFAEVTRYEGSSLAKGIRIRVLSRFAEPDAMAEVYRALCEREPLPVFRTSPGSLSWRFEDMHLIVDVGPREEIEATRLDYFTEYPQAYRFSFPLPSVVGAMLRALLGQGQAKNQMFAALLSDLGRDTPMSRETAVTACVLWDLRGERIQRGERTLATVPRSEETAELINRFLLEPLEQPPIDVTKNDAAWRNAKKVSHRFDLTRYLLQQTVAYDRRFPKRLSTPP
jgi:hypothetical protein